MGRIVVARTPAARRVLACAALAALFAAVLSGPLAAPAEAALTGPAYPPPGGVILTSSSSSQTAQGRAGGQTWNFSSFAQDQNFSHLYWGASSVSPPRLAMDGAADTAGETLTFNLGASNLAGGEAQWTGSTIVRHATSGTFVNTVAATRLRLRPMTTGGAALALSQAGSVAAPSGAGAVVAVPPSASAPGSFMANFIFEVLWSGVWQPAIDLYDSLRTDPTKSVITSFTGGFYFNRFPTALDQSVATDEDTPLAITLGGTDPDGNSLTFSIVGGPANGVLSGSGASVTYTPNLDYTGPDAFTFIVNDGLADSQTAGVVSINVEPENDPPVADPQSLTTDEDTPLAITLTGSDPVEGDPVTFTVVNGPSNGDLSGTAPDLTYTPDQDYNGADSFTFVVNDGELDSSEATVSITIDPVNDDPVAADDTATTPQYTPVTVNVLANDSDVDGDTTAAVSVTQPANGSAALNLDGTVTYTPNTNFKGLDSFTYTIEDGKGGSATGVVTIVEEGCGEDGLDALQDTPADGAVSGTIDRVVEPAVGSQDPGLAATIHETNCSTVVPQEQLVDEAELPEPPPVEPPPLPVPSETPTPPYTQG